MAYRTLTRSALRALAMMLLASTGASAGGLAIHEQSAYGQGASFAGIAAGGALSSMYWNPATITQFYGMNMESSPSGIIPRPNPTYTTSGLATALGGLNPAYRNNVDNSGMDALVPA